MLKSEDLSGKTFNRWTVLSFYGRDPKCRAKWLCQCICGTVRAIDGNNLKTGQSKSCGCLLKEKTVKHGHWQSPEYSMWESIVQRCCNPKSQSYNYYGGRGITICDTWRHDFPQFLKDIGPRPEPRKEFSLDRIDNNGNYEPCNVRWATKKEQAMNRRAKAKLHDVDLLKQENTTLRLRLSRYIEKFGECDAI